MGHITVAKRILNWFGLAPSHSMNITDGEHFAALGPAVKRYLEQMIEEDLEIQDAIEGITLQQESIAIVRKTSAIMSISVTFIDGSKSDCVVVLDYELVEGMRVYKRFTVSGDLKGYLGGVTFFPENG